MSNGNTGSSKYGFPGKDMSVLWQPDPSIPYRIHCKGHPLDGTVIVWPEIVREAGAKKQAPAIFCFRTSREHGFGGRIKKGMFKKVKADAPEIFFEQADGFGSPAMLQISVMTQEEFEILQERYKSAGWPTADSREQMVEQYLNGQAMGF